MPKEHDWGYCIWGVEESKREMAERKGRAREGAGKGSGGGVLSLSCEVTGWDLG